MRSVHADLLFWFLVRLLGHPFQLDKRRVTVIAPHQDDETLGCGGLIALKRRMNVDVQVIFMTDGGSSPIAQDATFDRETLPAQRYLEARNALQELKVPITNVHFLGHPDGQLAHLPDEERAAIISQLTHLIAEYDPGQLFVTHCDDGHADHEAAYSLTVAAVRSMPGDIEVWQYYIWKPWLHPFYRTLFLGELRDAYVLPIGEGAHDKRRAIESYISQLATLPAGFTRRFWRAREVFVPVKLCRGQS